MQGLHRRFDLWSHHQPPRPRKRISIVTVKSPLATNGDRRLVTVIDKTDVDELLVRDVGRWSVTTVVGKWSLTDVDKWIDRNRRSVPAGGRCSEADVDK